MTNMDTIPQSLRTRGFEQTEEWLIRYPLTAEQIATSAVAAIAEQLRVRQGLPATFEPEVADFINNYF